MEAHPPRHILRANVGESPTNEERAKTNIRQVVHGVFVFFLHLAGCIGIYGLYDLFRPIWSPSFILLIFPVFYAFPVLIVAVGVIHLARGPLEQYAGQPKFERGQAWLNGVTIFLGCLFACQTLVYDPIKFAVLAHRIESASTVEEERAAFLLANRLGNIWEVNPVFPENNWPKNWTEKIERIEIEWPETPAWTVRPYRAQRTVLDRRNIDLLYK